MFVVAIIVILAAVIIPNFTDITDRSKNSKVSRWYPKPLPAASAPWL